MPAPHGCCRVAPIVQRSERRIRLLEASGPQRMISGTNATEQAAFAYHPAPQSVATELRTAGPAPRVIRHRRRPGPPPPWSFARGSRMANSAIIEYSVASYSTARCRLGACKPTSALRSALRSRRWEQGRCTCHPTRPTSTRSRWPSPSSRRPSQGRRSLDRGALGRYRRSPRHLHVAGMLELLRRRRL